MFWGGCEMTAGPRKNNYFWACGKLRDCKNKTLYFKSQVGARAAAEGAGQSVQAVDQATWPKCRAAFLKYEGQCLQNIMHLLKSSILLRVEGSLEQVFVFSSSMCSPGMSYTAHV
eukprot:1156789-Pelagomonas_calceolata.AAC.3